MSNIDLHAKQDIPLLIAEIEYLKSMLSNRVGGKH